MRNFFHNFFAAVTVAFAVVAAVSCGDDMYDNSPDEPLRLSVDTIIVDLDAQAVSIGVTARDAGWTMTGAQEWCTVDPASGDRGVTQVKVTFAAYETEDDESAAPRETTLIFSSGGAICEVLVRQLATGIVLPNQNADYYINEEIHSRLAGWYYNGEPGTAPADYNQSYDDFYFNYLSKELKNNEYEKRTWARDNETYIHSYIEKNPAGTAAAVTPTPPLNYGMEFEFTEFPPMGMVGRILYVEPRSPAAAQGLQRGDWFYEVNDVRLDAAKASIAPGFKYDYNRLVDSLVNPVEGERPTLSMLTFSAVGGGSLRDEGKTVTLTPERHPSSPILATQTFTVARNEGVGGGTARVGYMMYNSFDERSREELLAAFRNFAGQELDTFILDVRYNKSGTVEMAELMGNLLVGNVEGVAGTTFARYEFDAGSPDAAAYNRTASFAPHEYGIGVDTLFVLATRHTTGAAELLINALRGLDQSVVKLVMVGETTAGMAAGMVKQTYRADEDWEYSAWMLAFRAYNARQEGDHMYGLTPNSNASEMEGRDNIRWSATWGWKPELGATQDPLLKVAHDMIKGQMPIPPGEVMAAARGSSPGFPREYCFPANMTMKTGNE